MSHSSVLVDYGSFPAPSASTRDHSATRDPTATRSLWSRLLGRYGRTRKCVSSKAALLVLVWSFALGLWNGIALNPDVYSILFQTTVEFFRYIGLGLVAFVFPSGWIFSRR